MPLGLALGRFARGAITHTDRLGRACLRLSRGGGPLSWRLSPQVVLASPQFGGSPAFGLAELARWQPIPELDLRTDADLYKAG